MLNPDDLYHQHSADWTLAVNVARYVAARIRKPMDKEVRSRLCAECPRPLLAGKVALTPEIYGKMATFITKFIRYPKKGIDQSSRHCQDKLLMSWGH